MPSHITHALFGYRAMETAGIKISSLPLFAFGCQGPDMFLHGSIRKPTGVELGRKIHCSLFGRFVEELTRASQSIQHAWSDNLSSFILGYITHGVLDRKTHPYINYLSGWGEEYHMCHPFLERLIDGWALKLLEYTDYGEIVSTMDLGNSIPDELKGLLSSAIHGIGEGGIETEHMIDNSYRETLQILKLTNRWNDTSVRQLMRTEVRYNRTRLLALLRPEPFPDLDFLNLGKKTWRHPMDDTITSNATFPDLFEEAIAEASELLRTVLRSRSALQVGRDVGNLDLNTGFLWRENPLLYSDPLPLGPLIDSLYPR